MRGLVGDLCSSLIKRLKKLAKFDNLGQVPCFVVFFVNVKSTMLAKLAKFENFKQKAFPKVPFIAPRDVSRPHRRDDSHARRPQRSE